MFTFLLKEVQVVTKGRNLVLHVIVQKRILMNLKGLPPGKDGQSTVKLNRQTLFQKIMCSLLKLCSGQIEELKERTGRGRKGC